mgnify:CR=1 FL=1
MYVIGIVKEGCHVKLFYVDPQSYNNLADYDRYLLASIDGERHFFCSTKFCGSLDGVRTVSCFGYNDLSGLKKIVSYTSTLLYLCRMVKKHQPDIVHFQWFKIPLFDRCVLKQIKRISPKSKIVFTAHNVLPHDTGDKYKKYYGKIYNFVDGIIVHGNRTKQSLVEAFGVAPDKVSVIPHGFLPRKPCRKGGVRPAAALTFSLIGSLTKYKGVDLLVDAWTSSAMLSSSDTCRLIIAGGGRMACLSKAEKCRSIQVVNKFLSDEELDEIVDKTDVSVLPYREISQSGVLLTMLAAHKPVIVSDVGDITQPFDIAQCGWILPDVQAGAIRMMLEQIARDKSSVDEIKNDSALWEKIDSFYSWEDIGRKTTLFYNSLCMRESGIAATLNILSISREGGGSP